jgi:deoxyadenosine/deoxycytidine kinase
MHIAIAGNIGSGKTTLAGVLAKHLDFDAQYEDPGDNPYIQDFYSDMTRWSFNMQIFFLQSRIQQTITIQQGKTNVIQDRTLYEDAEIFAPNLQALGLMSDRDYANYRALYDTVIHLVRPPDLVIYLKASISTLVEQIAERNREYEDNIRIDYLKKLNDRYDDWFAGYTLGAKLECDLETLNVRANPEHLGTLLNRIKGELFGLFRK